MFDRSTLLLFLWLQGVIFTAWGQEFMNCVGFNTWLALKPQRRCCKSADLPNNCECFDIDSDFTNTFLHKPACPGDIGISFTLFTRSNQNSGVDIKAGQTNIKKTPFDGKKKTKILTHGFTSAGTAPWLQNMKDELLAVDDLNVIIVNWKNGASGPDYYQAAANTRTVGAAVARLVLDLVAYKEATYENIHLIGHSLGAHVMGSCGKEIERLVAGKKIGRITGLDPAGPCFESFSANVRLDRSDALFVDAIHTDAEILIDSGFGIRISVGHADFYPNGGQHQPGCPVESFGIMSVLNTENGEVVGMCSHSRATVYYTSSIRKCRFDSPTGGATCTMGYNVSPTCTGDHFPTTTGTSPFC